MSWSGLQLAADRTHHVRGGEPVYAARFDEVLAFHAPGLAPVRLGAQAWHIRSDGSPAYTRRFERTFGFYEGRAAVVSADGWHHIDAGGHDCHGQRYAWCGNFQGGRCTVREHDGHYRHIDADGRAVGQRRWRYAGDYRDGIAVVQAADGRSTHVDVDAQFLHERWFLDLDVFHKGFARAREQAGWTHITRAGTPIYARRFATVEPFYNGQARVERFDGALEVIDETGRTLVELRGPTRSEFAALSADMVGFWRTQTVAAAVELGVFEVLPASVAELAERCGLKLRASHRLLRALDELGLVCANGRLVQPTARGALLRASHPWTLADAALEYAGPLARMWERLPAALRVDGDDSRPDIFAEVAADPRRRQRHHRMLRSYARHDYPPVIEALGLRGHERIIDAGGGVGVLARLLLDAHPHAHVTVLERAEVVEQGRAEQPQPNNLGWRAGDLLQPWPLRADVVLLSRVLHDWDDDDATRILVHARAALPAAGRVCVIEMLLAEGESGGALCDLHLFAVTGGRERGARAYAGLLAAAGFELEQVHTTGALVSVITALAC